MACRLALWPLCCSKMIMCRTGALVSSLHYAMGFLDKTIARMLLRDTVCLWDRAWPLRMCCAYSGSASARLAL